VLAEQQVVALRNEIRDRPEDYKLYGQVAHHLLSLQRYAEAIENLDRALELHQNDWQLLYHRGHTKYSMGDMEGAKRDFTLGINADSLCFECYLSRAVVDRALGDTVSATRDHARAMEIQNASGGTKELPTLDMDM
jgi:tetratricopeptide (TPR) repeat protein